MLKISQASLDALATSRIVDFRARLVSWLMLNALACGCEAVTPYRAEAAADAALALCRPEGITDESDVTRVAMRALRHGPDFADRPEFDYVRPALAAPEVASGRRVMLLKLIERGHLPRRGPWHV